MDGPRDVRHARPLKLGSHLYSCRDPETPWRFVIRSGDDPHTNVVLRAGMRWNDGLSIQRLTSPPQVGGASRRIDNMKRTIVVLAATLILTAGQAMAEGLTPPRHVNGLSLDFRPICYCTCLDKPCDECYKCLDFRDADTLPDVVGTALSFRPNTARPKLFERTTNRDSTPVPHNTYRLSVPAL